MNEGGGLLCVWDSNFLKKEEVIKKERWICVKGFIREVDLVCVIGVVYDPHSINERRIMWNELLEERNRFRVPFILIGDFNEILKVGERFGTNFVTRSMTKFRAWVNEINLIDLPIVRRKFTWRRGKSCNKLNRVPIDSMWNDKYLNLKLLRVKCLKSDHIPLFLDTSEINWGPKPF